MTILERNHDLPRTATPQSFREFRFLRKFSVLLVAAGLLSACLLDSDEGSRHASGTGYVRMSLTLDQNLSTVFKSAGTDSTYELDSIKIILTAPGAATQTYTYPISGRPDTGAILAGTGVFGLDPLRTWKAKILTIDTSLNPARTDTVHMDSISFNVRAADTTAVSFTLKAVLAILRVRVLSTSADSLGAGIQYSRIRVNGVTRDSLWMIGHEAHNAVMFTTLTTGWIAADEGKIWKSIDSGNTWYSQNSGTSANLYALWFNNSSLGWAVGDNGTILRTKNGTTWASMPSGTTSKLNRVMFVSAAKGWIAGDSGVILRTSDSGSTWHRVSGGWFSQSSPNSANLNAVYFTSPTAGWAVGASGNILRTTNSGTLWTSQTNGNKAWADVHFSGSTGYVVGDSGKIVKTTDGGSWTIQSTPTKENLEGLDLADANTVWAVGKSETILKTTNGGTNWIHQTGGWYSTESNTTSNLKSVNMGSGVVGWAVGTGGYITKTTDAGLNWNSQTPVSGQDLNTVYVLDANRATAVGNNGTLIKSNINGTSWAAKASNTTKHLRDLDFFDGTTGWAVGDSETIVRTTDTLSWRTMPGGWLQEPSGVTDTLNAIRFVDASNGWAVGNTGKIIFSTDGGDSWASSTSGISNNLRGVQAVTSAIIVAVGDNGMVRRTTNTGSSWSTISISTTDAQRAVYFTSATVGFLVGDSGTIRRTQNAGSSWANQALSPANGTALLWGIHSNGTYVWSVGAGGVIYYRNGTGTGSHTRATNARTTQLNDVYCITSDRVVAVGQNGTILRTTNGTSSGGTWGRIDSGLTNANLRSVWFKGTSGTADTGYIVGDGGVILESVNSGASWVILASGTTKNINALHVRLGSADSAMFAGEGGMIARTINGGINWTGKSPQRNFNGVDFVSATTGWVVASDGRVLKTVTAGTKWVVQDSAISTPLNGVYFRDANTGWVVGNNGIIRRTTNGGTNWTTQASGLYSSIDFLRVHFKGTTDTGYAVGEDGNIVRTLDAGANWDLQVKATSQSLRGVFVRSRDTAYAAGDSGKIIMTSNGGVTYGALSTRQDLKGTYCPSSTVAFAVGTSGTILKTTNSGSSWVRQSVAGLTGTLYAVSFPTDVNTGYVVGEGGKIAKTTNGGTLWTPQTVGGEDFKRVYFTSASIGYTVGTSGTIYKTTNAGGAWVAQNSGTAEDLTGVIAVNSDSAFAVGSNGTILKTRAGGAVVTTVNLNSTYFRGDTGYVVGMGGTTLRTGNSGFSWTTVTGTTNNLNDVFISPSGNNLYAVGDGGTYITTSNATAPSTWTDIRNSGTTRNLNGIWVSGTSPGPAMILAVGDSGTVRGNVPGNFGNLVNDLSDGVPKVNLRAIQCIGTTNDCWAPGGNETVIRTTHDSAMVWVTKSTGPKFFDQNLVYKYLKPGVSNTVILQAIDRHSPLRGFQSTLTFTLGAGQDSTITTGLTRCGYGGATPACSP